MSNYQPFLISEFNSGINTYLQPWMRPKDSFDPLVNAYVYRGAVNKRAGSTQFGNTIPDNNPVMGIMRWQNPANIFPELVVATTVNLYYYDPGSGNYVIVNTPPTFTGNITNFFNSANWQPSVGSSSLLWMCNGKDAVTSYDGGTQTANQPTITVDGAPTTITTALDVKVYKERLLLIRPTLSSGGVQNQSIYWSALKNPTNWRTDIAGSGGFIEAPTGDAIVCAEFIRDVLVVFFTNSTWIFRYTGSTNDPFRWDKVNDSRSATCPYASVDYDSRCTAIGNTGLIACDGINVQRYDQAIIDYYQNNFSEQYFSQAFSQRYDNLSQAWTLYVSDNRDRIKFPLVNSIAPGSDKALVYNFAEDSWATYSFPIPLTCMGIFFNPDNTTWADLTQSWADTDILWAKPQKNANILLAGSTNGKIYFMDNELAVSDLQANITNEVIAVGSGVKFYTGTVASPPVLSGTFESTDGTEIFTSDVNGVLTGSLGGSGSINYTTGVFVLNFASVVPIATNITAYYLTGRSIVPDIVTTRWNPVLQLGQKTQFGYIDIYYYIASENSSNPVQVTLNFYVNNSNNMALSKTLTLDGPPSSEYAFKRIYLNLSGEFIQMEIDPNVNSFMQFVGFIIWARAAGRLTS